MTRDQLLGDVALGLTERLGNMTPYGFACWRDTAAERIPELAELLRTLSFDEVLQRAFVYARREAERAVRFRPPPELAAVRAEKDRHGIVSAHAALLAADREAQVRMAANPGSVGSRKGLISSTFVSRGAEIRTRDL
jgi:hypothetical protein